jgi:hypothetical protein
LEIALKILQNKKKCSQIRISNNSEASKDFSFNRVEIFYFFVQNQAKLCFYYHSSSDHESVGSKKKAFTFGYSQNLSDLRTLEALMLFKIPEKGIATKLRNVTSSGDGEPSNQGGLYVSFVVVWMGWNQTSGIK